MSNSGSRMCLGAYVAEVRRCLAMHDCEDHLSSPMSGALRCIAMPAVAAVIRTARNLRAELVGTCCSCVKPIVCTAAVSGWLLVRIASVCIGATGKSSLEREQLIDQVTKLPNILDLNYSLWTLI